jgi:ferric-dicitrate binding protein FerR (iron transport regulator)
MKKEYLVKRWLDNELTLEEEIAFKNTDDYDFLIALNTDLQNSNLKSNYNEKSEFYKLKDKIELQKSKKTKVISLKFISRIAAVFLFGLGTIFYFNSNKNISTLVAETITYKLPDNSKVTLDASSKIKLKRFNWNRNIILEGEAYFEVEKGKKFRVATKEGTIEVLGTKFNIITRDNYFETVCYEGSVLVTYKQKENILKAGERFLLIADKVIKTNELKTNDFEWSSNKSSFRNTPIKYVLEEFQRHYKTEIKANFNTNELFTGSFTHDNKMLALKSITLPLNLKISQEKKPFILSKND